MTRLAACLLALAALTASASAQQPLNLDFESRDDAPDQPDGWLVGGPGYEASLDAEAKSSGSVSLRIRRAAGPGQFGVATATLPVATARGRTVRLSGMIRTEELTGGGAALWLRVDGPDGSLLALDNMGARIVDGRTEPDDRRVRGTADWARHAIEVRVPDAATNINFGVLMSGRGTAWFDALEITLDGTPYAEADPPTLTPEQLDWLRAAAVPFDTERAGSGLADLRPLKALIGDARIVALGEATHGTAEFFRMKHRLLEFLVAEMGFTVFAIEASMPEAFRLNDYVLRGEGDPAKLLEGMYFWTWNTQEVLDMILWMREFNASGRGRLEFLGFDMQEPKVAAANVRDFVTKHDPAYADALDRAYASLKDLQAGAEVGDLKLAALGLTTRGVLKHLEANRDQIVEAAGDDEAVDWAIQNARIVVQAITVRQGPPEYRDRSMADNVDWILAHRPPGTKIVLWAHNGHVSRRPGAMGSFLHERHGAEQVVVGFAFHEGEYTAIARGKGLQANPAKPSTPGSVEHAFHRTGHPRAILDLRRAEKGTPTSGWLAEPILHRNIGALATGSAFASQTLPDAYDLLIFFAQTTASTLLPPHAPR